MESAELVNAQHRKCDSCGGEMTFSPSDGLLVCPYCGHKQELEPVKAVMSHDYLEGKEPYTNLAEGSVVAHCENCGANITFEKTASAQICPFCSTPMTLQPDSTKAVMPDGVVPFQISQEAAAKLFRNWIRGKFFAPKQLRDLAHMQNLNGLYVPHFLFDCSTSSSYSAEAGTHYYETETVTVERDGQQVQEERQVMKTSWRPVSGHYSSDFSDQIVNASKNVDHDLIRFGFDLKELKQYTQEYLYGFEAENYSISLSDCWITARIEFESALDQGIKNKIAADEVRNLSVSTSYSDIKFRYILLPLWFSSYTFKKKTYKLIINGQNGRINGHAPLSAKRILLSILLTVGVPALLCVVHPVLGFFAFIAAVITLIVLATRKPKPDPADPSTMSDIVAS